VSQESNTKSTKTEDPSFIWNEYSKAMDMWTKSYKVWQNLGTEAMKFYLHGCKLAMKTSNLQEVEKYHQLWQKTIENLNFDPYSLSNKAWIETWKDSGFVNLDEFQNYWQDMWKNFTVDSSNKSNSQKTNQLKKEDSLNSSVDSDTTLNEDEIIEQFNESKSGESSRMSSRPKSN